MENLKKAGRFFYCLYLICLGIQQFIYADFRPIFLPDWPAWIHRSGLWAYLAGAGLLLTAFLILFTKMARTVCLISGGVFLLFFFAFHVPYQLFFIPNDFNIANWTQALELIALAGGAFIIAGSYPEDNPGTEEKSTVILFLEKLIPAGRILFSVMFIVFGIDHFIYAKFISGLVPAWIPFPMFWTYFAGVALVGSGTAIILKIKLKQVSTLLAIMLFLWVILLHIPRAVNMPNENKGNEITSAFDAFCFCGVALVMATTKKRATSR
jgi:uncharacterized membrane protein YphA (DoxX/SURF4 family)